MKKIFGMGIAIKPMRKVKMLRLNIKALTHACLATCIALTSINSFSNETSQLTHKQGGPTLQDKKRNYLRYLAKSEVSSEREKNRELSISELLDYANTAFEVKEYEEAARLSQRAIERLQIEINLRTILLKDALLLNYKSVRLSEYEKNPDSSRKRMSPEVFRRLMSYCSENLDEVTCFSVLEDVSIFIYELPLFKKYPDVTSWPIESKSFRLNYTRAMADLILKGIYKSSTKRLQMLASSPDYKLSSPTKVFYYLGINALVKHRFSLAEEYFSKVLEYSKSIDGSSIYPYMARDYLYHLKWRKKDRAGADKYWSEIEEERPTVVFQPRLALGPDINPKEVEGGSAQLTLSVNRDGFVTNVELSRVYRESEEKIFTLVKNMFLNSRISPVRDEVGKLINSKIKVQLQIRSNLREENAKENSKLDRVLEEFYPGTSRNRSYFVQRLFR